MPERWKERFHRFICVFSVKDRPHPTSFLALCAGMCYNGVGLYTRF